MLLSRLSSNAPKMVKSVCIIGAGPSGLVAAKTLLHNPPNLFKVTIFDSQPDIGGLWPTSPKDSTRQVHPLMLTNQSRHTVQFSDHAWWSDSETTTTTTVQQFPKAWQVGSYLKSYLDRYLAGNSAFEMNLGMRVVEAVPEGEMWSVRVRSEEVGEEYVRQFDKVLVASGFFGRPIIPEGLQGPSHVPIVHSSKYRDLKQLLGDLETPLQGATGEERKNILVIGGQISGVQLAATIALHLSNATNSPDTPEVSNPEKYKVHHVIQRPVWVFPLFTSPEPTRPAAPFLPLEFTSLNLSNRPGKMVNTHGHITEDAARRTHDMAETTLGTDQEVYSAHLHIKEQDKTNPAYYAVDDWYCEFVRSGLINLSSGRIDSLNGTTATSANGALQIENIAAVVLATGFDASPCLDFLPTTVLQTINHSPKHTKLPVALDFHSTHHPDVPGLGFVGFYRPPHWGVMEMQARFLAAWWSGDDHRVEAMTQRVNQEDWIRAALDLRDDPRQSQFPMGDYPFMMQAFSEALDIPIEPALTAGMPALSHNGQRLDVLTPARYGYTQEDMISRESYETRMSLLRDTHDVALAGLTTSRFVPRAVFRSLLGTWSLERDLTSRLPSHPSGYFSGTARFLLRKGTSGGLKCATAIVDDRNSATQSTSEEEKEEQGLEYLYIEDGEFKTSGGFGFRATRRYVYRYDERREVLSVWFVKPDNERQVDYLFHELEFGEACEEGWPAKAGHLCIDDYYDVQYMFSFAAVNLMRWGVEYTVRGPQKDYTIKGTYTR